VPGVRNIFRFAVNGGELRLDDRWTVFLGYFGFL